ncbi:4438_t:CDS:1, partial [Entrophospora sp. SA101]
DELETKEPIGLTPTRQWYLYDEIRDFVQNPIKKDIICPEPTVARP